MPKSFNCPNCNASLDFHRGDQPVIRCSYCNSQIIVPEELRASSEDDVQEQLSLQSAQLHEIEHLIHQGRKIEAIRKYREAFGVGLREAKEAVEGLQAGQSVVTGTPTGETGRRAGWLTCGVLTVIVAIIVLCAGVLPLASTLTATSVPFIGPLLRELNIDQESDEPVAVPVAQSTTVSTSRPTPTAIPTEERGFATPILTFGNGEGSGSGYFTDARRIAVDGANHIYVGEYSTGRVQVFDDQGTFLTQWSVPDEPYMVGMAADRDGIVYVVAGGTITRYDGLTGERLDEVTYAAGRGFDDAVVTADGGLIASWYSNRDDIVRFDRDQQVSQVITEAISTQSGRSEPMLRVAADGLGNIYALSSFSDAIYVFSADGRFVNRFGGKGDAPGQLQSPDAIAVDGQGRVYVSDFNGIHVFDGDGRYLDTIEQRGVIFGMTFNDQNELLALDRNAGQVVKYAINE